MINKIASSTSNGRVRLLELKMETSIQQQASRARNSIKTKGHPHSSAPHRSDNLGKPRSNPESQLSQRGRFSLANRNGSDLNKIANVVFTLPEIKASSLETELTESLQIQEERIRSYCSAKLEPSLHQKTNKNLTSRYYRQIEVLKEMRDPVLTQRVFTIMDLQNQGLEDTSRQNNLSFVQTIKSRQKKATFPNSALDKYQIIREKGDIIVPLQLKTKRFSNPKVNVEKKKVQFKVNLTAKRNLVSKVEDGHLGFKLEGWEETLSATPFDY